MKRSLLLICALALLVVPAPAPAEEPPPVPVEDILRSSGFTQFLPSDANWVSVELLGIAADLDGKPGEEFFTRDWHDVDHNRPVLTARRSGMPVWSRPMDRYAWVKLFDDVDSDGGRDLLVYEQRHRQFQAFATVDVIEERVEIIAGATGQAVWSIVRPSTATSAGVGGGVVLGVDLAYPLSMSDATGDGIDDVLLVNSGPSPDPEVARRSGTRITACTVDGQTGIEAERCVVVDGTGDVTRVLPIPDASGDGLADVLTYSEQPVDRHVLGLQTADGREVWGRLVDSGYSYRWPEVDYAPGTPPGRILFGRGCVMMGCYENRFDAYDARTGRPLWHRYAQLTSIGDVDGDGGSDLAGWLENETGPETPAVVSSATGRVLYEIRAPGPPTLAGYSEPEGAGWLVEDFDGDGVLDTLRSWKYTSACCGSPSKYLLIASRGRDGSDLWRRFVDRQPVLFGGDADGAGSRDLRETDGSAPPYGTPRWMIRIRDGSSYEERWAAGPFARMTTWREPLAADVDGVAGDELVLSWYEDEDSTTDNVDYLAAFGPAGQLWKVAITLEGTAPAP